ncbi:MULTISPECIES: hypothetical protein [unclassified Marinobacter]|jgi:hypothetical protein|uniref:hypothetical protein n=1 Tax=unclassified Marinobacter TaxID=83889 RepID=UPI000C8B392E|nr:MULTISPECIES: hypothetical protein [unclassified Marinobacter]MAB54217.1 hypothetical protein [Marinobacter sp.]|tara:strand:- start:352 stop:597 length:246 start_codon:yes stop_codon:yes gene_type:complete
MKVLINLAALSALTILLTGCFNGSSGGGGGDRPDPAVDFSTFVKAEIANTDDTREAVQINDKEFSFNDQNNEQAFDDLFIQ